MGAVHRLDKGESVSAKFSGWPVFFLGRRPAVSSRNKLPAQNVEQEMPVPDGIQSETLEFRWRSTFKTSFIML
jgi:hypothetical protein